MSPAKISSYRSAMTAIKSQDALLDIQTSNFSKFKQTTQKLITSHFKRAIKRLVGDKSRLANYEDIAASIGRLKNG